MSHPIKTAGIILAGGSSTRFGRPKQLLELRGKYLIEHVLEAALLSELNHVVLVLGNAHQDILKALGNRVSHKRLQIVINHRYLDGQSRSVRAGLSEIRQLYSAVMFLLGDQPILDSSTINYLLDKFHSSAKDICVPTHRGRRGNPVIFGCALYDQLMAIKGDIGARDIIRNNLERVLFIELENPLCFFDIDSPQDFEILQSRLDS
jgi:molybdenum cofactor cytidylyltransferase